MRTFLVLTIVCLLHGLAYGFSIKGRLSIQPDQQPVSIRTADAAPPVITIMAPDLQRSLRPISKGAGLTVIGKAVDASGIAEVSVNGKSANIDEQGNFSADILLKVGENLVTVTALDTQGNKASKTFTISRPAMGKVAAIKNDTNYAENSIHTGTYYALLIAVESYLSNEINKLDHPVNDATQLEKILQQHYTFDAQNIILLKNPNRKLISKTFNDLRNKLTTRDNLLIFYAGHGVWMEDMKEGYWLPQDASGINDPTDWIANSTIRNYIRALKAKHILVVADACFSGSIFKVRDAFIRPEKSISAVYELQSRKAITSGSLKTVPDRSVFLEYFSKRLKENKEKYLDSQKLFVSFKEAVINNSPNSQTPLYGAINETGDEGGDFIFVRREQ